TQEAGTPRTPKHRGRAVVSTFYDYYPFGMQMPGRKTTNSDGYRFGFIGMEKDDEVKGSGNSINYKARIYDPRLGKFLSVDPLTKNYPWYTPYQFAGNKPIWAIDVDGLEEYIYQYTLKDNQVTLLNVVTNSELKPVTGGWGAAYFQKIDKRTGKPMDPKEIGMVQYQYLNPSGEDLHVHRSLDGEWMLNGDGEMMPLHQKNFDGSIYISSPFGKDPMVG